MAASSRHPQNVPLPASPEPSKQSMSKKGKGKERAQTSTGTDQANDEWAWLYLTDSSANKIPPIFTKNGSYFFSIVRSSVKIYSVATGQLVSTLSTPPLRSTALSNGTESPSDLITSAVLNPHNEFQLIVGSLNGCIMIWDFLDAVLLQIIDIGQPIYHVCAHEKFKDSVFVAANRPSNKKNSDDDNGVVLRVSLKPSSTTALSKVKKSSEISPIGKTSITAGLAFSPNGAWLVAVAGYKAYVAATSSFTSGFTKYVSLERLTCLAFHPLDEFFATGDDKGNIRLWYCLAQQLPINAVGVEKKAQTTTLHWHAHAVSSIAFTPNGAYLLSGGEESVLVIWQLHTGKKEFVPRLGAPIDTIAISKVGDNEEEYLLGLSDASYVFVAASNLKMSRSYSRIKLDPTTKNNSPHVSAPLAVHTLTSTLILPSSHPSSLQAYSPSSSKLISELEVSSSNRVSRRDEKPIEPSRVEVSVVSPSSEWMATVDSQDGDSTFRGEIYLKIWWWDRTAGCWVLNTRIDRPHGLHKVTAVVFSPSIKGRSLLRLVTTGADGNIKTWRIRSTKNKDGGSEEYWVSRSTVSFRSEIPSHASWSPDGSLLSISLGPYVALYDPVTNALRQSLLYPVCKAVTHAHFIGRGGRYLAVVGIYALILWDLVTQSVRWHYKTSWPVAAVIPHPLEDTFALFHRPNPGNQHTKVCIFRASSPVPSRTHTLPFGFLNIAWCSLPLLIPSRSSAFRLVGITKSWSVVLFGDDVRLPEDEGSTAKEILAGSSQQKTLFQDIFGKSAFTSLSSEMWTAKPEAAVARGRSQRSKEVTEVFDGPAYLMPPLESLFEPLVNSFLTLRSEADVTGVAASSGRNLDDDIDMEDEAADAPVLSVTHPRRIVSQEEMDLFIDLFKKYTVKSKPGPALFQFAGSTANGTSKHKANGAAHHSAPAPITNGAKTTPKASTTQMSVMGTPATPSPSQTIVENPNKGKKRKKSLG